MSFAFDPYQGLVVVRAELTGPSGNAVLGFALDTGATITVVNAGLLVAIGYEPGLATGRVEVTTGSGIEYATQVTLGRIVALGQTQTSFPVLAHTLPPSAGVDGLIGLDFLRSRTLSIDFQNG